jgi:arylsulfatase A-like enzyme
MKKLLFLSLLASLSLQAGTRPNIIWIFSDDHTNQAIGAYGGPLAVVDPTPNIDRLAAEGMRSVGKSPATVAPRRPLPTG